ncbi:uncharacterized protein [Watersipora subatra]|uniref:uncharacterized protein n=1 Tax=Watersipora subatra TaxID=2589382 RepID=UPI00355C4410
MAAKLDMAIKDSKAKFKIDKKTQAILDEFDIDLEPHEDPEENNMAEASADGAPCDGAGHGKPFGSGGTQVETTEANIKPTTFNNRFMYKRKPVVLEGLLSTSPAVRSWQRTYFANAPPSAMSNISTYDSGSPQLTQAWMSMRDFVKNDNTDLFIFDEIPSFLMKDVAFPNILKCDSVLKRLKRHFITYYKRKTVTEPVMTLDDRLICSITGKPSYVLVPHESWESLAQEEGSIDYSKVNYETHPWLAQLKYSVAQVDPANCLYVPAGWYVQSTYTDMPAVSIVLSWSQQVAKVSKADCGQHDLQRDFQLGHYSEHFSAASRQRNAMTDSLIHYFAFYLGDHLASSFTQKQFLRKVKRDQKMFAKLINWTEEVEEICIELFETLDMDENGRFSLADIEGRSDETLDMIAGQVQDRLQDLGAIMDSQQALAAKEKKKESKPATPNAAKKAPTDDMEQMFKEELQKEIEKMVKDLEANENKSEADNKSAKKMAKNKPSPKKANIKEQENGQKASKEKDDEKYSMVNDEEVEILAETEEVPVQKSEAGEKSGSKASSDSIKKNSVGANNKGRTKANEEIKASHKGMKKEEL